MFMESWILQVSCKVNMKLHLLCKRPEVFMIPLTFQKSNLFLKGNTLVKVNVALPAFTRIAGTSYVYFME